METAKTPQVYTSSGYELPESSTAINRDRPTGNEAENPFTSGLSIPQAETTDPYDDFPDGGTLSWLVVLGSFFLLMASYGLMNSVGVLASYLETHQLEGYSSRDVGWISGIFVWTSLGLGVFVGPLFDAYGPKELVTAGTGIYSLSILLMAECTLYWHFFLCFGFLAGIGAALISNVGMSCVPHWFQAKAGMAIGTAMAGSGLGGVIFPYILRGTFGSVGYKWGMRVTAFIVLVICGIASFLVKSRLPRNGRLKAGFDIRCFKDARFTWMALAIFCLELVVFALIGLLPTYVLGQGFSTASSINLLVVLNVTNCVGRLIAGRVADKYGRLNLLILLIALAVILMFTILYPFSHSLVALYIFSAIYGITSGSFICLAPVCVRQTSPAKEIGMRFGTFYCLVSLATLICIPIGGEMLEKVGAKMVVVWLGVVLVVAMGMFLLARWAWLGYRWDWGSKI